MYNDDTLKTNSNTENMSALYPNLFEQNLFSQDTIKPTNHKEETKYRNHEELINAESRPYISENKIIDSNNIHVKKISKIIVYYSDNTFESFEPNIKG